MKRIILNFESKGSGFKELVQEAFNKDILDFLISKNTHLEFEKIERVNLFSKDTTINPKYLIYDDIVLLNQKMEEGGVKNNIGFYMELTSKEDELEIKRLSKTGQVDFIIVRSGR